MNTKIIKIHYTNWKNETAWRQIEPIELWYGHTQWHPEDQWLLKARDIEKDAVRDFAMKDIQEWNEDERHNSTSAQSRNPSI